MHKFLKNILLISVSTVLLISILIVAVLWTYSNDIPDYKFLKNYKPPVSSKVYSGEGELVADFSEEKRVFVPYSSIPKTIIDEINEKLIKPINKFFKILLILFPLYKGIC